MIYVFYEKVEASIEVFGDFCYGTLKCLQAEYKCTGNSFLILPYKTRLS